MSSKSEEVNKLKSDGKATILDCNIPENFSYSGQNFIELDIPVEDFKIGQSPQEPNNAAAMSLSTLSPIIAEALRTGFFDPKIFPKLGMPSTAVRFVYPPQPLSPPSVSIDGSTNLISTKQPTMRLTEVANPGISNLNDIPVSSALFQLNPDTIAKRMQSGERFVFQQNMFGSYKIKFIPILPKHILKRRLLLVETYRLSSFLGNYGAGKTIKAFSLLPGERTRISIKTYLKSEMEAKQASSILDSFTDESSDEFENAISQEQSDRQIYNQHFDYHIDVDAHANWGWGSANKSGSIKGVTNSSREEFAKNISNAIQKHTSKASAKRDVYVNTSFTTKTERGQETSIEREIQNINVGGTLNFIIRQMNQEFITLLHLVDIRVAYFDGTRGSAIEVPLPDLQKLLDMVISPFSQDKIRKLIKDELETIIDYKDQAHCFIEEKHLPNQNGSQQCAYLRIKKDMVSIYEDENGTQRSVPGIILSSNKYVMRTDGIIIDSILGKGDGLDKYSHGLQDESIRSKLLANELMDLQTEREELGQQIVKNKDDVGAKDYQIVFNPPKCKEINHEHE